MNGMRRAIAGKTPTEIRSMSKESMKVPITQVRGHKLVMVAWVC